MILRRLTAAVGIVTLGFASLAAAPASPSSSPPASGWSAEPYAQPTPLPDTTVTLITGDTVNVSTGVDGRMAVTLEPAPQAPAPAPAFQTVQSPDGDVYVYPATVRQGLASGRLDRDLFNITQLVAYGYDDEGTAAIPVIVGYGDDRQVSVARTQRLPAAQPAVVMPRLNLAGVRVDKARAGEFWQAVDSAGPAAAAAGDIERIWLDDKVEANLDESLPLIGADQAHAAGVDGSGVVVAVLDTGIDAGHPDLVDQVLDSESFVPGVDPTDGHGHGTHVAGTIAGTGAASGGQYLGVAHGADLLVGKVLNDGGRGQASWTIAGMEWAVDNGADIVNLSLGSSATDGTDPQSMALNQLSASSGTLFVAAAGNSGRFGNDFTVGSPAAADAALAVANFDKSDRRSDSSSRGPRVGDHAIKPEIAGPGVGIAAARAAGTDLGSPVDDFYTRVSGTSMATPHVAGVAAMLAQQHPDWPGEQLKDVLTSTAQPADYTVYLQGSGRVDAARATTQPVYATGQADFRLVDEQTPPQTETVTYTNTGDEDVTLDLSLDVSGSGSAPPPGGMFTLSGDTVTVPAGGQAELTLTLDPGLGDTGRYSGYLVGSGASDVVVTTAVGLEKEAPSADLTVNVAGRFGAEPASAVLYIQDLQDPGRYFEQHGAGNTDQTTIRLPIGEYSIYGDISTRHPAGGGIPYATDVYAIPEVSVTEDGAEITIDARQAQDVEMHVPQEPGALAGLRINQGIYRESANGVPTGYSLGSNLQRSNTRWGAIPSGVPEVGELYYSAYLTQREPLLQARVVAPAASELDAMPSLNTGRIDGTRRLPVVYAGAGQPEDYDGLAVDGKLVLVTASSGYSALAATAAGQGAAAIVVARDTPGTLVPTVSSDTTVPVMAATYEEGQRLLRLRDEGPLTIELTGVTESRYGYPLRLSFATGIPDDLSITVDRTQLAEVVNSFHSDVPDRMGREILQSFAPWEFFTGGEVIPQRQPVRRVDYLVPGPDLRYQHNVWTAGSSLSVNQIEPIDARYVAGQRTELSWHQQPYRPADDLRQECNFCRSESALRFAPSANGDAHPEHAGANRAAITRSGFRDGQPVADLDDLLVPEPATYRIEDRMRRVDSPGVTLARQVDTVWTFRSQAPDGKEIEDCEEVLTGATECAALPVILPRYDLPVTMLNRAPDGRTFTFTVHADRANGYAGPADLAQLEVSVSYDGGQKWQPAQVANQHGTSYRVTADHPPLGHTTGAVSLRVAAADDRGNRIRQTIIDAYALDQDACIQSHSPRQTVTFGDRDSVVPNYDRPDGCTFLDLVWTEAPFDHHGHFVRMVIDQARQWWQQGLLTRDEQQAILVAAARSNVGR